MSAVNALVIGAERSVGFWLLRRLTAENQLCRGQSLGSWERVTLQGSSMPFFVILPSIHSESDLDNVSYWINLANEQDAPVFFLSSLSVFDSNLEKARTEFDCEFDESPLATKLLAIEESVRQARRHIILRTGEGLSFRDGDLAHEMLGKIRTDRCLVADDKHSFYPTADDDIADVLVAMLKQASCSDSLWGTYHFCGVERTTLYSFSEALLSEVSQYEDLSDVRLLVDEEDKPNWLVAGSDNTRLFHSFGIKPKPWRSGMARLARFYYRKESQGF